MIPFAFSISRLKFTTSHKPHENLHTYKNDSNNLSLTSSIYLSPNIQGKRKMVDGFIRWCKKGDVGLSQKVTVESITDEEPTGLFDDFYVPTGR